MKRREFLKYLGIGAGGAGLGFFFGKASKPPGAKLIPYLVPPDDIIPGVGNWYASLCTECAAGCGILVKVMDGRAKKIEGNPLHPVSRGKLCARGQSLPQYLYNPDRIKGPLKRTGERGKAEFTEISWEEAIKTLSENISGLIKKNEGEKLYFVTSPVRGHLQTLFSNFVSSCGSSNYVEHDLFGRRNLLYANQVSMGINSVPHYDIANTKYLLSFGADLTAAGLSPVSYSYAYGQMRQGSSERGKLVQVEPRLSLTGANADEWVPAKPGTEGVLALSIAYAIVEKGYYRGQDAGSWRGILSRYNPKDTAKTTDVSEDKVYMMAKEFMQTRPSMALAGESVSGYENGVSGMVAANILNYLSGSIGSKGGVIPNPEAAFKGEHRVDFKNSISKFASNAANSKVKTLIVHNANPVFTTPNSLKLEEALRKVPFIVSISSFMDETAAMADLVLPANTSLEDWGDDFAEPSTGYTVATIMQPAVTPLYNTKGAGDIMILAAKSIGGKVKDRLPSKEYSEHLRDSWREIYGKNREMSARARNFEDFWEHMLANGGFWSGEEKRGAAKVSTKAMEAHIAGASAFEGDGRDYPFYLMVYPSGHRDGRGANIPWLQELPDPMTSVVWGTWVEMNPRSAEGLGIKEGDMVSVESAYGKIKAPVYLYPGIRPDTVSIPVGQGHSFYGRYAKGRGANPIELLAPKEDPRTGAIAINTTRVKIVRTGENGKLVKTEGSTKELGRGIVQTVSLAEYGRMKKEVL